MPFLRPTSVLSFLVSLSSLSLSIDARAERILVKNPQTFSLGDRVVQSLTFGNDTYAVVETSSERQFARLRESSEAASQEMQIEIPEETAANEPNPAAWHTTAMRYAELPGMFNGFGVLVAVLDTGVDYTHPNLRDRIYWNMREIPGNFVDDDQNGYIDDVRGWDFDGKDADPMDGRESGVAHGTHCAGIIAAAPDAATGAMGVAPGVTLMPLRIIGSDSRGFLSNAAAAIKYAVDNGARILSNSWNVRKNWTWYDPSDANLALLRAAVQYASDHGAIFVAAAGNDTVDLDTERPETAHFPQSFEGIENFLLVAASDAKGAPARFTDFGVKKVGVAAPGVDIVSTVPDGFEAMSGTSMATPLVAGALARGLGSVYPSPRQAIDRLVETSDPAETWKEKVRSGGVVNLYRYLHP